MSSNPPSPITSITVSAVHSNTSQTLIQITQDKLKIELSEHLTTCEQRRSWQVPAATLLTLILTLTTTEFKDSFGLNKDVIKAIFIVCSFLSAGWLFYALLKIGRSITINQLIEKIKNTANSPNPNP